jgi:hypothetical protein
MNDPLGPPRWLFRDRSIKEHLQHHAVQTPGKVQSVQRPRSIYRPDGTSYLETGFLTIRFWDGAQMRQVTSAIPSGYQQHIRPGQTITILYCPHYPAKIYRVMWPITQQR